MINCQITSRRTHNVGQTLGVVFYWCVFRCMSLHAEVLGGAFQLHTALLLVLGLEGDLRILEDGHTLDRMTYGGSIPFNSAVPIANSLCTWPHTPTEQDKVCIISSVIMALLDWCVNIWMMMMNCATHVTEGWWGEEKDKQWPVNFSNTAL